MSANEPTHLGQPPARSRRALLGVTGAVAVLAGAGWGWWRQRLGEPADAVLAGLWTQQWDSPAGPPVTLAALRGRPLIINFWATWCPPCVEELPLLDAFWREQRERGWQVLGLAIDQPSAVRQFLQRQPLGFAVGLAGLGGTELTKQLGNPNGALPFTVVIDSRGALVQRKLGQLKPQDLKDWLQSVR